ncbi:hypothetical protein HN958_03805 [Candidatus Falkowbacteria bacterium]|nr:hypothetical protein [Candidatus Falkowbacteria bacterium]MBT7007602.1 hypothetical protein [Candidatus Falkowbacteria bacterium]
MKKSNGKGKPMTHYAVETILLVFWIFVCVGINNINLFPFSGVTALVLGVGTYHLLKKIPARNIQPKKKGRQRSFLRLPVRHIGPQLGDREKPAGSS